MKKFAMTAVAMALSAAAAQAATVTFTIKTDDPAASTYTGIANSTGIYADVSAADNGGLVSYYFTLQPGVADTVQGAYNTAPFTQFAKNKAANRPAGFDFLRSTDAALQQSATQETTNSGIVPVYGYGQQAIDLNSVTPTGYSNATTGGIQPDPSVNPSTASLMLYAFVPLSTFKGTTVASYFVTTGGANGANYGANVWTNTSGVGVSAATAVNLSTGVTPPTGGLFAYDNGTVASTLGGSSAGPLNVKSPAPGKYLDAPVLTAIASTKGFVSLATADLGANTNKLGVGGEEPVFVLVNFNLGSMTLAQLEAALTPAAGSDAMTVSDSTTDVADFNVLQGQYPGLFASGSSLLFKTTADSTSTPNFGWDLTGLTGVSVNNIIAVPEPASLGLMAIGALGLLGRKRK